MCQGKEGMNKGCTTKQLSAVGDWSSIALGSLGPGVEHRLRIILLEGQGSWSICTPIPTWHCLKTAKGAGGALISWPAL